MDPSTEPFGTPVSRRRLPRARITLPLLGLVAAALVARPAIAHRGQPNEADILGMANAQGILLAEEHPSKGTPMYQWDPELHDIPPFYIGAVVDTAYRLQGKTYILVKRPHSPGLCLDIKKDEMRYWVRKDGK